MMVVDAAGNQLRWGLTGVGRGRWGSSVWGVARQPRRPKKAGSAGQSGAGMPARAARRRQECPRHTGAAFVDGHRSCRHLSIPVDTRRQFRQCRRSRGRGRLAWPYALLPLPLSHSTRCGDKVCGQGVSAKHPLNPTLNPTLKLTLKRNAYSTRLLLARLTPGPVQPGHSSCAGPPCPATGAACGKANESPEGARHTSPGQRPFFLKKGSWERG